MFFAAIYRNSTRWSAKADARTDSTNRHADVQRALAEVRARTEDRLVGAHR